MKKELLFLFAILFSVSLFVVYSLRGFFYSQGISLFAELLVLSDFDWLIKQFSFAWNDYFVLGHPQVGYPLAPGASTLIQTTNPVTSLIDIYFLKLLNLLFSQYWQFMNFFLAIFLHFGSMFLFIRLILKQSKLNLKIWEITLLSSIAGLIFMMNPMVGDRFGSGGVRYIFSQSLIPLFFYFYFKIKNCIRYKDLSIWLLILSLLFFYQIAMFPHFVIAFFLFVVIDLFLSFVFFKNNFRKSFINVFIAFTIIGFINALLFGYVLIPALFYKECFITNSESGFFSLATVRGLGSYATLENVIRVLPYKDSIDKNLFYIYPLLFLIGLLLLPFKRKIYFLLFVLLFVFLAKGLNVPFENFSIYLFEHITLLHAFRDSTKFLAIVVVFYVWAFSLGVGYLLERKEIFRIRLHFIVLPLFLFFVYLLIYINPIFLDGNFNRILNRFEIPKEYVQTQQFFKDKPYTKVVYFPFDIAISQFGWYGNSKAPTNHFTPFHTILPINGQIANAYENDYLNTYSQHFMKYVQSVEDPNFLITMLRKVGVEYIIDDQSYIVDKVWKDSFFGQKKNKQTGIFDKNLTKKVTELGNLSIYKIPEVQPYFESNNTLIGIVGDLNVYNYFFKQTPEGLLNSTFVFLEFPDNYNFYAAHSMPVFFWNSDSNDFLASKLLNRNQIILNKSLINKSDTSGWIGYEALKKDVMMELDNFGLIFLSKDLIGTETLGAASQFPINIQEEGEYEILVRVLHGNSFKDKLFDSLTFLINEKETTLPIYSEKTFFKWYRLGRYYMNDKSKIEIRNNGGFGLIDGFIIVSKDVFNQQQNEVESLLKDSKILTNTDISKMTNKGLNDISFKKINATTYDLNDPGKNLVFKQNFSPFWVTENNSAKFIGDYYANGFLNNENFQNDTLFYQPQEIYSNLLALAKTTFVCILVLIGILLLNYVRFGRFYEEKK